MELGKDKNEVLVPECNACDLSLDLDYLLVVHSDRLASSLVARLHTLEVDTSFFDLN